MSADTPNPPAFPTASVRINSNDEETSGVTTFGPGMSLRDYFAAKAVQGMFSNPDYTGPLGDVVKLSFEVADAMLAARGGEK